MVSFKTRLHNAALSAKSLCATVLCLSKPRTHEKRTKLVILDFDGTLFDTVDAIIHCFNLTFEALLPGFTPDAAEMRRLISVGAPPEYTLQALQPKDSRADTFHDEIWVRKYRELYKIHGQALQKPFPGARDVLLELQKSEIPFAIISNKAAAAIKETLQRHGLSDLVDEKLIVGDPMYGENRKPHPAGYTDVLLPRLKQRYGEDWLAKEGEVVMVGDTVTDIKFARSIGARICWCRFGDGDKEACEKLKPDFTIEQLQDVLGLVCLQ
ncbi:HAD-like domain-containing protein [Aspergillus egyptiacus]|nr:HAD-like domain-containing protein [Aspergillus egyptiacus]